MSSTTSSESFLSSPRSQRMLLWISAAVLVVGLGIFLGVFLSRGTAQPATVGISKLPHQRPTDTNPIQNGTKAAPKVPASHSALGVARTFLETAVVRKNLTVAYGTVGPFLKNGTSRAQWLKGNNPVIYFPAANARTAHFTVKSSTKNALMLNVGLKAAQGAHVAKSGRALTFQLEVDRIHGKWLVNYFMAINPNGVPAGPGIGR